MRIQIFGDETKSKLLALHPMLADGASMVQLAGHLQEDYCIIAPDLSGQGKDTGVFESAGRCRGPGAAVKARIEGTCSCV